MIDIKSIAESLTLTQYVLYSASLLIPLIVLAVASFIKTKSWKLILIEVVSSILVLAATLGFILIVDTLLKENISRLYELSFFIAFILNFLSVGTLFAAYVRFQKRKNFDIDFVTRDHFNSTLSITILVIIVTGSFVAFMPKEIIYICSTASLAALVVCWINHFAARALMFDPRDKR